MNDPCPRAITPGEPVPGGRGPGARALVRRGVSLGVSATILCGIQVGERAMVAAESVVIRNVPLHTLVAGVPARVIGRVCACERRVEMVSPTDRMRALPRAGVRRHLDLARLQSPVAMPHPADDGLKRFVHPEDPGGVRRPRGALPEDRVRLRLQSNAMGARLGPV